MLSPILSNIFFSIFDEWIEADSFLAYDAEHADRIVSTSIRLSIASMYNSFTHLRHHQIDGQETSGLPVVMPEFGDFSLTVGYFWQQWVSDGTTSIQISEIFRTQFVTGSIPVLTQLALLDQWADLDDGCLTELASFDITSQSQLSSSRLVNKVLPEALFHRLEEKISGRPLFSFFVHSPKPFHFFEEMNANPIGLGSSVIDNQFSLSPFTYNVFVESFAESDDGVTPVVWKATCRQESSSTVLAYARGTGYLFGSRQESGTSTDFDSDATPTRADQMRSAAIKLDSALYAELTHFFRQVDDAAEVVNAGTVLFVSSWERRKGHLPGLGSLCIEIAVAHLQNVLSEIGVVVFNVAPAQFTDWHGGLEPGSITVAKMEAVESLAQYVDSIQLPGVKTRKMLNVAGQHLFARRSATFEAPFDDID